MIGVSSGNTVMQDEKLMLEAGIQIEISELPVETNASSGDLPRLEDSLDIREHFPDSGVQRDSPQSPELGDFGGFLALVEESFPDLLIPLLIFPEANSLLLRRTDLAGDPTSLEEIVESDSERGDIWLHTVDVVVYLLVMASRGEMSLGVRTRVSSRPQHPRVLCFLLHRQWIMECLCRV
ncbi:hypothetical protein Taro_032397 [Colocasia esculenta]|uniref:Uncharacterized protein n=1 Tax=Colocasia esculenta TaxID=4460 RepID=A0A843W1T3_COLES|nr:hypothetical protein [Colocasia esculenta]